MKSFFAAWFAKVSLFLFKSTGFLRHRVGHTLHWSAHAGYFGFVFFDAHGRYRYFAGVLLVLMVVDLFAKKGDHE